MAANGGWVAYPNSTRNNIFSRADGYKTKTVTIKSGQVLKARSWLQAITSGADLGKMQAHGPLSETALVTFAAITAGQTLILGGLTWTAGTGGTTVAQLVTAWSGLAAGTTAATANAAAVAHGLDATVDGTFTGTLGNWETSKWDSNTVAFTGNQGASNVTDLADTGTATDPTISTVGGTTSLAGIGGLTIYDVDASGGDVEVEVFIQGSFWNTAITWGVDAAVDTITKEDGTTVACSAYNTGTIGSSLDVTKRLQTMFVQSSQSAFRIDFLNPGEQYNV